jgi:octaprenyl-diphosphate synthase
MSHFEMDSTSTLTTRGTERERHSSNDPTPAILPTLSNGEQKRAARHSPTPDKISAKEVMLRLSEPVAAELMEVEIRLGRELQSPHDELTGVLQHGTQIGGKRLRPALVLLTGTAVGPLSNDHVVLGTVVEMVHTATLIHDDVLDDAETRRHVATINARWDEHTSILVGDYLFAQSFRLAATLKSTEACRLVGEAARLVCEGELRQVLSRDILSISEKDYFSMIRGKTAELCRVACELGAKYSGGSSGIAEAMGQYGDSLGVAFQIADDFLDLWGHDATVGKTLGTDIRQGKMTLPLIRLRDTVSRAQWQHISQILTGPVEERLPAIMPFLEQSDARSYTQHVAESFKRRAIKSLDCIPCSEARHSLSQLASFSVDRSF